MWYISLFWDTNCAMHSHLHVPRLSVTTRHAKCLFRNTSCSNCFLMKVCVTTSKINLRVWVLWTCLMHVFPRKTLLLRTCNRLIPQWADPKYASFTAHRSLAHKSLSYVLPWILLASSVQPRWFSEVKLAYRGRLLKVSRNKSLLTSPYRSSSNTCSSHATSLLLLSI